MFVKLATEWSRYYADRADLARLRAMDDRMLQDLGLTRGDLKSAPSGAAAAGKSRVSIALLGRYASL